MLFPIYSVMLRRDRRGIRVFKEGSWFCRRKELSQTSPASKCFIRSLKVTLSRLILKSVKIDRALMWSTMSWWWRSWGTCSSSQNKSLSSLMCCGVYSISMETGFRNIICSLFFAICNNCLYLLQRVRGLRVRVVMMLWFKGKLVNIAMATTK